MIIYFWSAMINFLIIYDKDLVKIEIGGLNFHSFA